MLRSLPVRVAATTDRPLRSSQTNVQDIVVHDLIYVRR
jgi:hypothetical protein